VSVSCEIQYWTTEDSRGVASYVRLVQHRDAMDRLPEVYRTALLLRDDGIDLRDIAARLDVDLVAIEALIAIGEEKLARLLAQTA
jgi:DNA-directed RNA polymerase specialized sigma24 family protein